MVFHAFACNGRTGARRRRCVRGGLAATSNAEGRPVPDARHSGSHPSRAERSCLDEQVQAGLDRGGVAAAGIGQIPQRSDPAHLGWLWDVSGARSSAALSAVHVHHQGLVLVERSEPGGGSPFVETVGFGDRLGLQLAQAVGSTPELSAVEL